MATLSYDNSDPVTSLVAEVYATSFSPDIKLNPAAGTKLSLSSAPSESSLSSILTTILTSSQSPEKLDESLGKSPEEKKEVSTWIDRAQKGELGGEKGVKELDSHLKSRTFVVSNHLTAADVAVFAAVHSSISKQSHSQHLSNPSLTRHFDLLQNTTPISSSLPKLPNLFSPPLIQIDVENVPKPEKKVEPKKEKKEKAAAAATSGDAAAPVAPAPDGKGAKVEEGGKSGGKKEKGAGKGEGSNKADKKSGGGGGGGGKAAPAAASTEGPMPHNIDLRVGKIVEIQKHPDADSLYVEKIDVGEAEPRTVVSGLVNYIPIEQMRDRYLIAVCNLKPANMRGVKSFAMVLCATSPEGKDVGGIEIVDPPAGSTPGDKVYFEGFRDDVPHEQLNPKKKIFETVQPGFTTLETKEAAWVDPSDKAKVHKIRTDKGICTVPRFIGASLS